MIKRTFLPVSLSVFYAIVLRILFGAEQLQTTFSVMSFAFVFCTPLAMGFIACYFTSLQKPTWLYVFLSTVLSVIITLIVSAVFSLESRSCILISIPVFLTMSFVGGAIARLTKTKKQNKVLRTTSVLFILLPIIISPVEKKIGTSARSYSTSTHVDINAKSEVVWNNVLCVKKIQDISEKDKLLLALGFPQPISAELKNDEPGSTRDAIFSSGLVLHETVADHERYKKIVFSVRAEQSGLTSVAIDEHLAVGGKYFNVLLGSYELERLNENLCRLHFVSTYELNTSFNFYALFWADLIMKNIQENILLTIKNRAEDVDD